MPKTIEELDQLKEEYKRLASEAKELTEEELENVAGGGCQSYSSETYDSLGYAPSNLNYQVGTYHPLIVTALNSCKLNKGGSYCYQCKYYFKPEGLSYYCLARSKEYDSEK